MSLPSTIDIAQSNPAFIHEMEPQLEDVVLALRGDEAQLAILQAFVTGLQAAAANASTFEDFQTALAALTP